MMVVVLVLFLVVAGFWVWGYSLKSQRKATRFLFNEGDSPAKLNGGIRREDVVGEFSGDPQEWPVVTVIVPGRNEGHLLAGTLGSLCAMDYPRYRVVFVDDQSTDNTRAVCEELAATHKHLTVIHNVTPPPAGWVGKNWAVHQAETHIKDASADYLLFTDSDLVFRPACLKQMVRLALHRRCDIASLLPSLRYETLGELLGLLPAMVLITLSRSLYVANDPASPKALVAGGFLLAKRESYEALGGHESVRGQMIEDIALGMRAKAKGMRVFTAATHDLILARMYEGWRDTFVGLKKNAYAGANYKAWLVGPVGLLLLFAGALVIFYPVFGAWAWITRPSLLTLGVLIAGVMAYGFLHATARRAAAVIGLKLRTAWVVSFGFGFYFLVFMMSVVDFYRGGNSWAGRRMASAGVQTLSDAERVEK